MSQPQLLAWVALGLSAVALAYALTRTTRVKRQRPADLKLFFGAAAAVLVLGALATLPTHNPWSPGQGLAPAFVLGGAVVLLMLLVPPAPEAGDRFRAFAAAAQVGAATLGAALLVIIYARYLTDPTGGYALGALTAAMIAGGGLRLARSDADSRELAERVEWTALIAVALSAASYLAFLHEDALRFRPWEPLPVLFTGALALTLCVQAILIRDGASPEPLRQWLTAVGAVLLPLALVAWVTSARLQGTAEFLTTVLIGFGVFLVIGWMDLQREAALVPTAGVRLAADSEAADAAPGTARVELGLLVALLALGAASISFRGNPQAVVRAGTAASDGAGLHGYGIGLCTLAGIAVASALPARGERALLRGGTVILLLIALYRVFMETSGGSEGLAPDVYYGSIGLILGALLPTFLAGSAVRSMGNSFGANGRDLSALLRIGLVGLAAALVPLTVWVLIGEQPQSMLLVGLPVGVAFALSRERGSTRALVELTAVGILLSAAQFTFLLEPLGSLPRPKRAAIVAVLGVIAIVWILLTAWRDRRLGQAPGE